MAHSCYSPPPNIRQQFVWKLSFDGVKLMIPKPAEEIILMSVSWYLTWVPALAAFSFGWVSILISLVILARSIQILIVKLRGMSPLSIRQTEGPHVLVGLKDPAFIRCPLGGEFRPLSESGGRPIRASVTQVTDLFLHTLHSLKTENLSVTQIISNS